jgi:hypothetical protein
LEAEVTKPHGQEEERDKAKQMRQRAAADLAEARRSQTRSSSAIQDHQRGIMVRVRLRGERVRGNGRLGRTDSVKPTWGN